MFPPPLLPPRLCSRRLHRVASVPSGHLRPLFSEPFLTTQHTVPSAPLTAHSCDGREGTLCRAEPG